MLLLFLIIGIVISCVLSFLIVKVWSNSTNTSNTNTELESPLKPPAGTSGTHPNQEG